MQFTAQQIAAMLEGKVEGNDQVAVASLAKIEEGVPGSLTFLSNPKYSEFIYTTGASIAIVADDFKAEKPLPASLTLIRVADAYGSFAKLLHAYQELSKPKPEVSQHAVIAASARIGKNTYIGHGVIIGEGAVIGDGCLIYPHVTIGNHSVIGHQSTFFSGVKVYHGCSIGSNVTIHAGTVIGADGFGFAPNTENEYQKVPQIGNVIIEDHVEVGANTCIDRATLGSTIIRKGVKLDNLIQIAHNVEIGENTVMAAQCGVAGSTKIGKNCMIGGQVGFAGHLVIADGVKIAAQSGIASSIDKPGTVVQGSPAVPFMEFKKSYIGFLRLPDLMRELTALRRELDELKANS
ncbi:MAG: UDP-3-O-(3-hydroxymyristoyl)glucosamine N-acyltransferase [Flavobacteriales bacterium]